MVRGALFKQSLEFESEDVTKAGGKMKEILHLLF